jgi:small subunit ribosomal protein S17
MAEEEKDTETPEPEETGGDEARAEEAPAEEPEAAREPAAEAPAAEAEPEGPLHPKEARRRRRSEHRGEALPKRGADERQAERDSARARKAERRRAHRAKGRAKAAQRRAAQPAPEPPPARRPSGRRKVRQGVVVSDKADKTITVRIDLTRRHRLYEKTIRSSSTLHAHDERNQARPGDTVRVIESRPLSRTKRWRLVEIVERAR